MCIRDRYNHTCVILPSKEKIISEVKTMENRYELNKQLAQMFKGGVIMDVTTPEQAKIAESAGKAPSGAN